MKTSHNDPEIGSTSTSKLMLEREEVGESEVLQFINLKEIFLNAGA
jgi:hypothetical protein